MSDWLPRGVVLIGLLAGIFGFGSYLQKSEKPLNLVRNVRDGNSSATTLRDANAANAPGGLRSTVSNANQNKDDLAKEYGPQDQKTLPVQLEGQQNPGTETVYFCGAKTKKGKPCTRLVKGGGRCWQHIGRPAMVPQEKLLAAK